MTCCITPGKTFCLLVSHLQSQAGSFFCLFFYKTSISNHHVLLSTIGPLSFRFSNRNLSCSGIQLELQGPPQIQILQTSCSRDQRHVFHLLSWLVSNASRPFGMSHITWSPAKKNPDNSQPFKRFFFSG